MSAENQPVDPTADDHRIQAAEHHDQVAEHLADSDLEEDDDDADEQEEHDEQA